MTLIHELISFHTGYGNQVRLHDHYYDQIENSSRITGYMPISAHRVAFETLVKSQIPGSNEKVFMLTGSYGTGKSHLCLMLANYFALKPTSVEMKTFFDNWARRDPTGAGRVRNFRGEGRYLVAICEYGGGNSFEEMVLTGIQEALEIDGAADVVMNTRYKGALRQLVEWETRRAEGGPSGTLEDFLTFLGGDDADEELELLKKGLGEHSLRAMQRFESAYEQATGMRFSLITDTLKETLVDLLGGEDFKERYRGLVILADEFGYALSDGSVPMSMFQSFAELAREGVGGVPLIFIGTGHRRFEAYGAATPSGIDFRVVRDRISEVSLESAELEQIIAGLISPKIESSTWKQEIERNPLLSRMATETKKSDIRKVKLFDYLSEPELLKNIVQAIYPMHPLAVYGLTRLSQELASAARSVFSFFKQSPDEVTSSGSYSWYIKQAEIKRADGMLNIYTPDLLVEYFRGEIQSTNTSVRPEVHDHIRNYLAAIEEAQRIARTEDLSGEIDSNDRKVLDLMFVLRVSGLPVTAPNLIYGLNLFRQEEERRLNAQLTTLKNKKIIFQSAAGEFEFRRSNMADIDGLIKAARAEAGQKVLKLAVETETLAKWETLLRASEHNGAYGADKQVKRLFATAQDLINKHRLADGSEASLWDKLETERLAQRSWSERYEGVLVYVLCETTDDVLKAQQAVRSNITATIAVGIPTVPIPLRDKILDLKAVKDFMEDKEYQNLDQQEKALVLERLGVETQRTGYVGELIKAREQYLEGQNLLWYGQNGRVILQNPRSEHEPADTLMNGLFTKRNKNEHQTLNLSHPRTFSGAKDSALREAVEKLLDFTAPVTIDKNESQNRGEIRYLQNVFVNKRVLRQTADYAGYTGCHQLEPDVAYFRDTFPALVGTVEALRKIGRGEKFEVGNWVQTMSAAPFGLGPYALSLFLAVAIRYLGDELLLKLNSVAFGYTPFTAETVIDLATGKYPQAVFLRRELTPAVIELIDGVYQTFSVTPPPAGSHQAQVEAWTALYAWWGQRARLERTPTLYPENTSAFRLATMLATSQGNVGIAQSLIEEIKPVYGYDREADLELAQAREIITNLANDKLFLESHIRQIKDDIIQTISALFTPQGSTYADYAEAIRDWFNRLHPDQRDRNAAWQTGSSRTLIDAIPQLTDLSKMLLETIPAAGGFLFGKVDDWGADRSKEYIDRFKQAFETIENGLPKVSPPTWTANVPHQQLANGEYLLEFSGEATFTVEAPVDVLVRIAEGQDAKTARHFEPVVGGSVWSGRVKTTVTYHLISLKDTGEYSKEVVLKFRNLDEGYKLIVERAARLDPRDRTYTIRNPKDAHSLTVLVQDLINHLREDKLISDQEILSAVKEALTQSFRKDKG